MDSEIFYGGKVILCAQDENNSDIYRAKFVISDFSVNHNGTQLNRKTIDKWIKTLIHKPLVGKIVSTGYGKRDFSGHNMRVVYKKDAEGNRYKDSEFDTSAFGTFTDVGIEEVDGDECIVATCEIWRRFSNACDLILKRMESGTLSSSWEIDPVKTHYIVSAGKKVKVIDEGVFTAHCLLGSHVSPAYDCSKMLEVAETIPEFDDELASALEQDTQLIETENKEKEVGDMHKVEDISLEKPKVIKTEISEKKDEEEKKADESKQDDKKPDDKDGNEDESPADDSKEDNKDNEENKETDENESDKDKKKEVSEISEPDKKIEGKQMEVSELTANDIYDKIYNAVNKSANNGSSVVPAFIFPESHEIWAKEYGPDKTDTDMLRYTYTVSGDEVELSTPEPIKLTVSVQEVNTTVAELNKNLATAAQAIKEKDKEIAELTVYKDKFEQAERERIEAETAEKKEALRGYAVSSGLIEISEVSDGGEFASAIDSMDENAINMVIAERFMKKNAEKNEHKVETSEKKNRADANEVKRTPYYSDNDIREIMHSYLYDKR